MEPVNNIEIRSRVMRPDYNEDSSSSSFEELPSLYNIPAFKSTPKPKKQKSLEEVLKEHLILAESIKGDRISQSNVEEKMKKMDLETDLEEKEPEPTVVVKKFSIFCEKESLNFFNSRDITPILSGYNMISKNLTEFENDMLGTERVLLESALSTFLMQCDPCCSISDSKSFVNFILRNISTSSHTAHVNACYESLIAVLTKHPGAQSLSFSSSEIFMLLFNYGVDTSNCQLLQHRPGIKKNLAEPQNLNRYLNKIPDNWTFNLEIMLTALNSLMTTCEFKSKEMVNILISFLWMTLDDTLYKENLYNILQECILSCLECISVDKWTISLLDVAKIFVSLKFSSEEQKWDTIFRITESIPPTSEKSTYLRRQISFLSLKCIVSEKWESDIDLSQAEFSMDEFQIIIQKLVEIICDSSLTIAAKFVDLCIGHLDAAQENLLELCNVLRRTESAMHEKAHVAKALFVKIHARLKLMTGQCSLHKLAAWKSPHKKIKVKVENDDNRENENLPTVSEDVDLMDYVEVKSEKIPIKLEKVNDFYGALIQNENSDPPALSETKPILSEYNMISENNTYHMDKQGEGIQVMSENEFSLPIVTSVRSCADSSFLENTSIVMPVEESLDSAAEPTKLMSFVEDAMDYSDNPLVIDMSSTSEFEATTPIITDVRSSVSENADLGNPVIPYVVLCDPFVAELSVQNEFANTDDHSDGASIMASSYECESESYMSVKQKNPDKSKDSNIRMCSVKIVDIMSSGSDAHNILLDDTVQKTKDLVNEESDLPTLGEILGNKSLDVDYSANISDMEINTNKIDNSLSPVTKSLNGNNVIDSLTKSNVSEDVLMSSATLELNKLSTKNGLFSRDFTRETSEKKAIPPLEIISCNRPSVSNASNDEDIVFLKEVETTKNRKSKNISKLNVSDTSSIPSKENTITIKEFISSPPKVSEFPFTAIGKKTDVNLCIKSNGVNLVDNDEIIIIKEVESPKKKSKSSGKSLKKDALLSNDILVDKVREFSTLMLTPNKASSSKNMPSRVEITIVPKVDSSSKVNKNQNNDKFVMTSKSSFKSNRIPNSAAADDDDIVILKEVESPFKKQVNRKDKKKTEFSQPSVVINLDNFDRSKLGEFSAIKETEIAGNVPICNDTDSFEALANLNSYITETSMSEYPVSENAESSDDTSLDLCLKLAESVNKKYETNSRKNEKKNEMNCFTDDMVDLEDWKITENEEFVASTSEVIMNSNKEEDYVMENIILEASSRKNEGKNEINCFTDDVVKAWKITESEKLIVPMSEVIMNSNGKDGVMKNTFTNLNVNSMLKTRSIKKKSEINSFTGDVLCVKDLKMTEREELIVSTSEDIKKRNKEDSVMENTCNLNGNSVLGTDVNNAINTLICTIENEDEIAHERGVQVDNLLNSIVKSLEIPNDIRLLAIPNETNSYNNASKLFNDESVKQQSSFALNKHLQALVKDNYLEMVSSKSLSTHFDDPNEKENAKVNPTENSVVGKHILSKVHTITIPLLDSNNCLKPSTSAPTVVISNTTKKNNLPDCDVKFNKKREDIELPCPVTKLRKVTDSRRKSELLKYTRKYKHSPNKLQSPLLRKSANAAYRRKIASYKHSPKKHLSHSTRNNGLKSFLNRTGITLAQRLREKVMPSSSQHMQKPMSSHSDKYISDCDSDVELLYTDPKKFSDSDCMIVYESEDQVVLD